MISQALIKEVWRHRIVRNLMIVPLSIGLALPPSAWALRPTSEGKARVGLEEALGSHRQARWRMSRRTLLKRAGIATGVAAFGTTGLGLWAYREFATDQSFPWRPFSPHLEDLTRIRPVWNTDRSSNDIQTVFRRLIIDPKRPEDTRRSARDLRVAVRNVKGFTGLDPKRYRGVLEAQAFMRTLPEHLGHIIELIHTLDPEAFHDFPVQWEVLRLRQALIKLFADYVRDIPTVSPSLFDTVAILFRELVNTRYGQPIDDPFVEYLVSHEKFRTNPTQLFNTTLHNWLYWNFRDLSQSAKNLKIREEAQHILATSLTWPALRDDQSWALKRVEDALDARGELYPTRAAFEAGVAYYQGLRQGPVRPIHIKDVAAVAYARRELRPLARYFIDSGNYHQVPPDVLAAVALTNLFSNAYRPSYSLAEGFFIAETAAKAAHRPRRRWLAWAVRLTPGFIKRVEVQDRVADNLASRTGSPATMGLMQIRPGPTGVPWEYDVRQQHLWARWVSDEMLARWSDVEVSRRLMNPKWNIEAAAAAYAWMFNDGIARQRRGRARALPDLRTLQRAGWLATEYHSVHSALGPDPLLAVFARDFFIPGLDWGLNLDNATRGWVGRQPPYARILALEAGLFDEIPGRIVGLTDPQQLNIVFRTALGSDPYLRNAALRAIQELAQDPVFPARAEAARWLHDYTRRHALPHAGAEEREVAEAREAAVAAWRDVADAVPESVGSQVLVFRDPGTFDLVPLAMRWGWTVAVDNDGREAEALQTLLEHLHEQGLAPGRYVIGREAAAPLLQESSDIVEVTPAIRPDLLARLGLRPNDLPPPVATAITRTRTYLDLAA